MSSSQVAQRRGAFVQAGNVSGAHVNHTDVKVKDVTVRTEVPENCFSMTNQYADTIKELSSSWSDIKTFCFFPLLAVDDNHCFFA